MEIKFNRIIKANFHHKSIFRSIKLQVDRIKVQRECRGSSQEELQNAIKPTSIEGVIYAIVHLPSQKLYVGQTINSSLHRFRQHYWDSRNASSTFRNDNLHRNMANSSIQNWIIWPLEIIDKTLYKCDERKKEIINFRRIASNRENEWIKIFKSMQPRGFNITYPKKQFKNRRFQRRSNSFVEDSHYERPCRSCVESSEN